MGVIPQSESRNKAQRRQPITLPLIFAVLIHSVLLIALSNLIPAKQIKKSLPVAEISVRLQKPPIYLPIKTPPKTQTPREQLAETQPVKEDQKSSIDATPSTSIAVETSTTQLDYDLIREQVSELKNPETLEPAALGKFTARELPSNWTRKAVSYTPGMFKAAELPTKATVLDSWKSADGTANTRIKLPNGDIICGRREQQNPLDIYSMPIWMHRAC